VFAVTVLVRAYETIWHAYASAAHVLLHVVMSQLTVGTLIDAAEFLGALTVILSVLMLHPRTRRATFAAVSYVNRHAPSWAKPALIAAAFFPGQADEIIVVAILLWPVLRSGYQRRVFKRTIHYAWNARQ